MAAKGITVLNSGPVKVNRAETNGKAMAFVSGGQMKVEATPTTGSVRMVGTPGPAGRNGVDGSPGDPGPAGPAIDTSNLALDGGNF